MIHLRRLALLLSGLTFGAIAILAAIAPQTVAHTYGLSLLGIDGLAEFRAVYMGFWASLAIAMVIAARRPQETMLGDICGVMLLCQSLGRMVSLAVDGRPSAPFVGACCMEMVAALLIFAPRFLAARRSAAEAV
jgi:hypothetical protein